MNKKIIIILFFMCWNLKSYGLCIFKKNKRNVIFNIDVLIGNNFQGNKREGIPPLENYLFLIFDGQYLLKQIAKNKENKLYLIGNVPEEWADIYKKKLGENINYFKNIEFSYNIGREVEDLDFYNNLNLNKKKTVLIDIDQGRLDNVRDIGITQTILFIKDSADNLKTNINILNSIGVIKTG
ncbi:hypothetical protein GF322_01015 [Candidatus Dependentiae bacterium]|nr:hypothetical protein [Candidatus Dependentiae bacterium]